MQRFRCFGKSAAIDDGVQDAPLFQTHIKILDIMRPRPQYRAPVVDFWHGFGSLAF
jgi:hypothetical protein